MAWKHTSSPPPKKFKTVPSAGKVMATVFWDREGVLLLDFMEPGATITSGTYCSTLQKLRKAIRRKRQGLLTKGVVLLHDNARPHTAQLTVRRLAEYGWEVLPHPAYSPDLAPSDYHLFGPLKNELGGRRFKTNAELQNAITTWRNGQDPDIYAAGIDKLPYRWDKCLNVFGSYVEK